MPFVSAMSAVGFSGTRSVGEEIPSPYAVGEWIYLNTEGSLARHYLLQRTGERVTARLTISRSASPAALFPLSSVFRPPFPILRKRISQPLQQDGSPSPDLPAACRCHPHVDTDGIERAVDGMDLEGRNLSCQFHTEWGTTPAANDHVVPAILWGPSSSFWQGGSFQWGARLSPCSCSTNG